MASTVNATDVPMEYRLANQKTVCEITGYSRNRIYELYKQGMFPKPIKLGDGGAIRWRLSEIFKWIDGKAAA